MVIKIQISHEELLKRKEKGKQTWEDKLHPISTCMNIIRECRFGAYDMALQLSLSGLQVTGQLLSFQFLHCTVSPPLFLFFNGIVFTYPQLLCSLSKQNYREWQWKKESKNGC